MGPYTGADYNLPLCRLQHIYHGQPYARDDINLYDFFSLKNDLNVAVFWMRMFWGPPGFASGSVRQRYGSQDPDPFQNVTDPQHWIPDFFLAEIS
jgi:hypothetical protein